jgi:hypothetical protein
MSWDLLEENIDQDQLRKLNKSELVEQESVGALNATSSEEKNLTSSN